ncbi:MAG: hypothetical protein ACK55I_00710 [bacterium]
MNYRSPVVAPVAAGQEIGELVIAREGLPELRVPLVAESAVPEGGFVVHLQTALRVLIDRFVTGSPGSGEAA